MKYPHGKPAFGGRISRLTPAAFGVPSGASMRERAGNFQED
jgi:hypothetical protein